ncbi:MAG TPA: DUF6600 domain-containing protein [Candidatus Acidoferrales bacterium]|jgi:hypothetical protein|nr:DUF6600 domain-containing protein [Candidatus Acidoferrales bacterium]
MRIRTQYGLMAFSVLLAFAMLVPGRAVADGDDPPSRVARLSFTDGQVSFSPAGTDDWVGAELNRPMTTGDKLWTDANSRAELHVGSASIRLSDQTGFSFLNLDDHMMQIRLTEGTISLRVRRMTQEEAVEVDTPNLALSILGPGRYRINVNEAGDTTIINVRDGDGDVTGGGSSYTVHPGQQGIFTGTDTVNADIEPLPDADSFDSWCDERDLREDHSVAKRYVSDDVIGYEDLDDYGGWRPVPNYGSVWFPHVSVVGWAPYRFGHWVWISPWGWTWVDDAAWGFAPFHYGRWVFVGGAWGWVPCPPPVVAVAYVRPVYAPALVAWVGGPHFVAGVGFAAGGFAAGVNVGWFPLGPREVFVPSYPVSRVYVNNVNISNTTVNQTVINNYYNTTVVNKNVSVNNVHYVNQGVPGAVTATSPHTFTSAQPVGRNLAAVDVHEVAAAPAAVRGPAIVPPKQAVLGAGAASNYHPPAAMQNRAVVAKTTPPPPALSFATRQAAIEKNEGRPLSMAQARELQPAQSHAAMTPVKVAPPASPGTPYMNTGARGNSEPGPLNTSRPVNNGQPNNTSTHAYTDRPPTSRPASSSVNPQLEQKHQQQIQQLQQKQDQEYQKLQQKQTQEQQASKGEQQPQVQQKQQQQLEQLEQKHDQQQQNLKQKQQAEHAKAYKEPAKAPKSEDKSHK